MTAIHDLLTNKILLCVLITMVETQVMKGIIDCILNRRFDISRFFGDGGMPSAHSAVVASLCTGCAITQGLGSEAFAISLVLAMIVCRDATGVRRETGKQAEAINDLQEMVALLTSGEIPEDRLRELVGHTPLQVTVGLINGLAVTALLYLIL